MRETAINSCASKITSWFASGVVFISRMEAIAARLEAVAIRLGAIVIRNKDKRKGRQVYSNIEMGAFRHLRSWNPKSVRNKHLKLSPNKHAQEQIGSLCHSLDYPAIIEVVFQVSAFFQDFAASHCIPLPLWLHREIIHVSFSCFMTVTKLINSHNLTMWTPTCSLHGIPCRPMCNHQRY